MFWELKTSLNKSIEILKEHEDEPIEDQNTPAREKGVITVQNLPIYEDHSPDAKVIGGLVEGNELNILETWTDGVNTWGKLGYDQWVPIHNKDESFIEVTSG
jgi:hypothetical protein